MLVPFDVVVSRHGPRILAVCRAAVGLSDAEDVWSETFLAALAALSQRQREAIVYHVVAGLPYAEIAVIVGGTAAAARRASADGLARLRRTYSTGDPHG